MALQHRLGLLPERGPKSSFADRGDIGSDGPIIRPVTAITTRSMIVLCVITRLDRVKIGRD